MGRVDPVPGPLWKEERKEVSLYRLFRFGRFRRLSCGGFRGPLGSFLARRFSDSDLSLPRPLPRRRRGLESRDLLRKAAKRHVPLRSRWPSLYVPFLTSFDTFLTVH